MEKKHVIVLTGGGTAGHVWPNFALVEDESRGLGKAVALQQVRVVYMGSQEGMERELVEKYAPTWRYYAIATGKLRRYFSWRNFVDPFRIVWGVVQAFFILLRLRASVVFSKGGFVSAPVVWAAWVLRIPVVIHESDVTPALATRLTLPFCKVALTAFAETRDFCSPRYRQKILALGLPMRPSLFRRTRDEAVKSLGLDALRKTILIFGGSLGAEGMNKKIAPALPELARMCNVIHICGRGKTFEVAAGPTYKQFEFLKDEMADAYAAADLAICRAGASSIFELAAARVPMLLIPLGLDQSRGDQYVNAEIFLKSGWAEWIEQKDITEELLLSRVKACLATLEQRKLQLNSAPSTEATYAIGDVLLKQMGLGE